MTIPLTSIINSNTTFTTNRDFVFESGFENWKGVEYTEETIDSKRTYMIEGKKYPSITTILSADKTKQKILAKWRKRVGQEQAALISRSSSIRGKGMHSLCEEYLATSSATVNSYQDKENFLKIKPILDMYIGKLFCMEKPLFSNSLGIAGRTDLIATFLSNHAEGYLPTVVDFKTSGKTKYRKNIDHYFIQGAAYATMFEEMTGIVVPRVAIIIVTEELPEPQMFVEQTKEWIQPLAIAIETYRESVTNVITENINS